MVDFQTRKTEHEQHINPHESHANSTAESTEFLPLNSYRRPKDSSDKTPTPDHTLSASFVPAA